MKTKWWAIALMIPCTLFTSVGQILYKLGAENLSLEISSILFNVPLIAGLLSYGIGLVLLIIAFKGGELSVLYPIIATGYIWVSLASSYLFETDCMTINKWIGVTIIIVGISLIGWGARK
jgi:undecaprenyl phosphate-alpha-L-ara4N flippase subunit ArnE